MPIIKPTGLSTRVWASNGDIETPSIATAEDGWIGGDIPPAEYFNYLQNRTDNYLLYIEQEGLLPWYGDVNYLKDSNSYVKTTDGSVYRAKEDSLDQNPINDVAENYWIKIVDGAGALSKDEVSAYMLTVLGAANASAAQTTLGGTTVGKAMFTAADEAAARTAIGGTYFTDRANHSGVQAISSVTDLQTTLDSKEVLSNKATNFTSPNDTKYPTTLAVATYVASIAAGEEYLGQWNAVTNTPTLVSSTGSAGDVWQVSVADEDTPSNNTTLDGINDWVVGDELVFSEGVWTKRANIIPSLDTDDITEATNLYFTAARVRGVALTGISFLTNLAVVATDSILEAIGKLQAQITAILPKLVPSGGTTGQALVKNSGTDHDLTWATISNNNTYNITDLGSRAVSSSESVNLDCATANYWNVSLNSSNGTGTLTLNIINIPSTASYKGFTGHIRIIKGGTKTISITVPAGKTWNWVQGVAPTLGNTSNNYDTIMFHIINDEAKIHAGVVWSGTV